MARRERKSFLLRTQLIVLLFLPSILVAQKEKMDIIGFWQDMPVVGSGYSTTYQFFEDGTFVYGHNQMDCADSILQESGTFSIRKDKLKLKFNERKVLIGGLLIPSTGSCGSEFELQGGTETRQNIKRKEIISIDKAQIDPDYDYLVRMVFGNAFLWRLSLDPNQGN
jgi:hypothetical protein